MAGDVEKDSGSPGVCPACGMVLSKTGLRVEGTSYWQVLVVAAALIILIFGLAVAWKLIFHA